MFDRILVPLDGSATAAATLPQLRGLLKRRAIDLVLLRVVGVPPFSYADEALEDLSIYRLLETTVAEARGYVAAQAAELEAQGLSARGLVEVGDATATILAVAEREQTDVIALSTHGRSGLARWAFGSVTEKVLRASGAPLLVFRSFGPDQAATAPVELQLARILMPTDGSAGSLAVAPYAAELARLFGAEVDALHVVVPPAGELFHGHPEQKVGAALEGLRRHEIEAESLVRSGDPAGEILAACEEREADLIAMSTHGRTGFSRWLIGSVTERVLRAAPVPMLVVRGVRH